MAVPHWRAISCQPIGARRNVGFWLFATIACQYTQGFGVSLQARACQYSVGASVGVFRGGSVRFWSGSGLVRSVPSVRLSVLLLAACAEANTASNAHASDTSHGTDAFDDDDDDYDNAQSKCWIVRPLIGSVKWLL